MEPYDKITPITPSSQLDINTGGCCRTPFVKAFEN